MAIEDGAVLTRALDHADSIADALQLYQRNRVDRTVKLSINRPPTARSFICAPSMKFARRLRSGTKERTETRGSTPTILSRLS